MKIHRFFADLPFKTDEVTISDKDLVHQIYNVLKLHTGEQIELFDGAGNAFWAEITNISKKEVVLKKIESKIVEDTREEVFAYIPLLRRTNTELVVQKLTELGVKYIIPVTSDRSVKNDVNLERLKKISLEATEQSGQYFLTHISEPLKLTEALEQSKNTTQVVLDMSGESIQHPNKNSPLSFFIGPEGGWSDSERELFQERGIQTFSLGATVLRAETACIVTGYEFLL